MAAHSPYDEVPYHNFPIPQAQPEYLAAIATVRGLKPQDPAEAHVLELGCGQGLNLIALAEGRPRGTFLGVDSSERQIVAARRVAQEVGLSNIEFRQQDILDLGNELGTFDYIIAHGVYSNVDEAVRDKLLAVCQQHLAPQGVAFVSYSSYPGRHVHDMLRSMMFYQARGAKTTVQMVASGRELLKFLKGSMPAMDIPYNTLVQSELANVLLIDDSHLRHDLMGEVSESFYFQPFIAHASRHQLQFIGDSLDGIDYAHELAPHIEQQLAELTSDLDQRQQYRDVLRNRSFRQALLCQAGVELHKSNRPEQLDGLFLEAALRPEDPEIAIRSTRVDNFIAGNGSRLSTAVPLIKAALVHLGETWPNSISTEDLVAQATSRLAAAANRPLADEVAEVTRLKANLSMVCARQVINVTSKALPFTSSLSDQPTASRLARWQAERGDVATNRKHQTLRLEHIDQHVLKLLDGTRGAAQLVDELTRQAAQGLVFVSEDGRRAEDPQQIEQLIGKLVPPSLARLAQNAFLMS